MEEVWWNLTFNFHHNDLFLTASAIAGELQLPLYVLL